MSEEKICIDCNVSKPIEKFGKRSRVCYTCMHIRRNKGYDKICKLCNKKKDDKDYIVTFNMCKECNEKRKLEDKVCNCLLYTSPSPRDRTRSRMPSSA